MKTKCRKLKNKIKPQTGTANKEIKQIKWNRKKCSGVGEMGV